MEIEYYNYYRSANAAEYALWKIFYKDICICCSTVKEVFPAKIGIYLETREPKARTLPTFQSHSIHGSKTVQCLNECVREGSENLIFV